MIWSTGLPMVPLAASMSARRMSRGENSTPYRYRGFLRREYDDADACAYSFVFLSYTIENRSAGQCGDGVGLLVKNAPTSGARRAYR